MRTVPGERCRLNVACTQPEIIFRIARRPIRRSALRGVPCGVMCGDSPVFAQRDWFRSDAVTKRLRTAKGDRGRRGRPLTGVPLSDEAAPVLDIQGYSFGADEER